jgi:moderate conductance mechanosensitive channel
MSAAESLTLPTLTADLDWLLGAPLQTIVAIVVTAALLAVVRLAITHSVRSVVRGGDQMRSKALRLMPTALSAFPATDPLTAARRAKRAATLGSVLQSLSALVAVVVLVTVLANIWRWNLGPLIASAGVVGVAVGFGAQALVKDYLSGILIVAEDQFGVGDVVDLGEATGVVEVIGLRVTEVRDLQGTLWFVRNGEIQRVGNMTQGWSRAFVEVLLDPTQDAAAATELLHDAAASLADDDEISSLLLADAEVTGYEDLSGAGVRLRAMIKTVPGQQWQVQRALLRRIRERFDEAGFALALPHREIHVQQPAKTTGPANRPGAQDQKSTG